MRVYSAAAAPSDQRSTTSRIGQYGTPLPRRPTIARRGKVFQGAIMRSYSPRVRKVKVTGASVRLRQNQP